MLKIQFICLAIIGWLCMSFNMSVASPPIFNYQGTLNDSAGKPVTGDKKMVFRIYPALDTSTATALWTSAEMTVKVSSGAFSVNLGENPAFPANLFSEDNRYLGVSVEGTELLPRQKLVSVPYALQAGNALMVNPSQIPKVRAWRDGDLTVITGYQIVPLNRVDYDSHSSFDILTGIYTVPTDGYYHISANATLNTCQRLHIQIHKNSEWVLRGSDSCEDTGFASSLAGDLYLKAGDKIELQIYTSDGGTLIGRGSFINYMSIHLFSR